MEDFSTVAIGVENPKYEQACKRQEPIYARDNDWRSEFYRDHTRILFSQAYRRLKHKTQVFFAIKNDHVCTRLEHVNLVSSIAYTISKQLHLNVELTQAIALGHDLGHAPYGHRGEKILEKLARENGLSGFFHEKNSLHFVDEIETMEDNDYFRHNLNLTYATRDGIICHCGELNQISIKPRDEIIDLADYNYPGEYQPYTYEGCVVKMADKISYLARDIEDAIRLNILDKKTLEDFSNLINDSNPDWKFAAINNGTIVNYFINDVITNSTIAKGISLSTSGHQLMIKLMEFNYSNIYLNKRLDIYNRHVENIISSIFELLEGIYDQSRLLGEPFDEALEKQEQRYPTLISSFLKYVLKYSNYRIQSYYNNRIIYDFNDESQAIYRCLIDYLSGMSDNYLQMIFEEILTFN